MRDVLDVFKVRDIETATRYLHVEVVVYRDKKCFQKKSDRQGTETRGGRQLQGCRGSR